MDPTNYPQNSLFFSFSYQTLAGIQQPQLLPGWYKQCQITTFIWKSKKRASRWCQVMWVWQVSSCHCHTQTIKDGMKLTDTPLHIRFTEVSRWHLEPQSFTRIHHDGRAKPMGVKVFGGQLRATKSLEYFVGTTCGDEKGWEAYGIDSFQDSCRHRLTNVNIVCTLKKLWCNLIVQIVTIRT